MAGSDVLVFLRRRRMHALWLLFFLTLVSTAVGCAAPAQACDALARLADGQGDASAALADCLERTPAHGRVELRPGVYRLQQPLLITRPVTILTRGTTAGSPSCTQSDTGCATLLLDPRRFPESGAMSFEVTSDAVTLDRLIIRGVQPTGRLRGACGRPDQRPAAGGLRVHGVSQFRLTRSVLRDFTCYTALELTAGARNFVIQANVFGPNGDHRPGEVWSDGLTIHDAANAVVQDNRFFDNTDVQLVLGGCRNCRIERNAFSHSGTFRGAAFAELMLHAWPNTSGDFTGTLVSGNRIDCGAQRRCGYGIMIGSAPWYSGRTSGGIVADNIVSNALVGINIDALTGPMDIRDNKVRTSGGRHRSDCGVRDWPAVNVGPESRSLVRGDPSDLDEGSVTTRGCLLAREGD